MIKLFFDSYILACPRKNSDAEVFESYINRLLEWDELVNCTWADVFNHAYDIEKLIENSYYPIPEDLRSYCNFQNIPFDQVVRLIGFLLQKPLEIESHTGIKDILFDNFETEQLSIFESRPDSFAYSLKRYLTYVSILENNYNDDASKFFLTTESGIDQITFSVELQMVDRQDAKSNEIATPDILESKVGLFSSYESLKNSVYIEIVESIIPVDEKPIKLSGDHHGNDLLEKFSKKLVRNKYVDAIINNMDFKPNTNKFIFKVHNSGLIEIVLTDTDEGFGLVVQSTGRNLKETEKIAAILEKTFIREQI